MGLFVLIIVFSILAVVFLKESNNISNIRFEKRYNGFYLIYDQRVYNRVECRFLSITRFIKLF